MQKPLHPQENQKSQLDNIKNATKNFDYTTIADRLQKVSWSNSSHPNSGIKPVYGRPAFPLTTTAVQSKGYKLRHL